MALSLPLPQFRLFQLLFLMLMPAKPQRTPSKTPHTRWSYKTHIQQQKGGTFSRLYLFSQHLYVRVC